MTLIRRLFAVVLAVAGSGTLPAVGAETVPSIDGATLTEQECGACHMAFRPEWLPAASWLTILLGLDDHFGENATLDPQAVIAIADFLEANAADAPGVNSRFLRGVDPATLPLRITETPYWVRRHHELSDIDFSKPAVRSRSNCLACHRSKADTR